jgi:hypothetical protein
LDHGCIVACHLKWHMVCFEQILGMKINYHKSDPTPVNLKEEEIQEYAKVLCYKIGGGGGSPLST